MIRPLLAALALGTLVGCGHPATLQYDHNRAYEAAFALQADRDRASIAENVYELSGTEALDIRMRTTEASTDQESGEAEAVQKFEVE